MNYADLAGIRRICERAYERFHAARYVHPDPLEAVREVDDPAEREVVALIASGFALGRVDGILRAVHEVLARLRSAGAGSVRRAVAELRFEELVRLFNGFVYRFFRAEEVAGFLFGTGSVLRRDGSLEACFMRHDTAGDETASDDAAGNDAAGNDAADATAEAVAPETVAPNDLRRALSGLVADVIAASPVPFGILLPDPSGMSASKRLHLFLRWLVRRDAVDPGGWERISPSRLLVPMDTHMLRISRMLGLTHRTTADLRASLEVTGFFRLVCPEDPVRYDFSLTRFGIHPEGRNDVLIP